MKTTTTLLAGILVTGVTTPMEAAVVIAFEPLSQSVGIGSPVEVALTVSGLGAGTAPSVGTFDFDVTYDPGVLHFDSLTFGDPGLGDQLDLSGLGSSNDFDGSIPGVVNHFEVSLDSVDTLNSQQADAFTLSVFRFSASGTGTSTLGLAVNSFGDALGDPLPADFVGGSVTVVPEPGATTLVSALGMASWLVWRRCKPGARRNPE